MRFRKPPLYAVLAVLLALGAFHGARSAIEDWSTTAASNNSTPPDGFPENMAASAVNNSARELMAQVRRFAQQSVLATFGIDGGAVNAYSITPSIRASSLISGARFIFLPNATNTATAPTLRVGAAGALTIAKLSNVALAAGDLQTNVPAHVVYNAGLSGFVLMNPMQAGPGLMGSRGLSGANLASAPTTTYSVQADFVQVRNSYHQTAFHTNTGILSNNVGTAGPIANGRDQSGAFTAQSWVHFYFISDGAGTLATVSSATAPPGGPVMPTGYQYWAYIGAVRFNASSQLVTTNIRGAWAHYETALAQTLMTSWNTVGISSASMAPFAPPNSTAWDFMTRMHTVGGNVASGNTATFSVANITGFSTGDIHLDLGSITAGILHNSTRGVIANKDGRVYYRYSIAGAYSGTSDDAIWVAGYKLPNGGE